VPDDGAVPQLSATVGGAIVTSVVAAVIEVDGEFLVTRRLEGAHMAGLWEFPGGKIDQGETHEQALTRELLEELDAAVEVGALLFEVTHAYPDRTVALHFYRCALKGIPRPLLGQEMRWVARSDLRGLGFPPADEELVRRLSESDGRQP
jgi:8-oxo-dGTP diphosphatase